MATTGMSGVLVAAMLLGSALANLYGMVVNNKAAPIADLARSGERFYQPFPNTLTCHLHQTQGGNLGDLVARTVTAQRLYQASHYQLTIGF